MHVAALDASHKPRQWRRAGGVFRRATVRCAPSPSCMMDRTLPNVTDSRRHTRTQGLQWTLGNRPETGLVLVIAQRQGTRLKTPTTTANAIDQLRFFINVSVLFDMNV